MLLLNFLFLTLFSWSELAFFFLGALRSCNALDNRIKWVACSESGCGLDFGWIRQESNVLVEGQHRLDAGQLALKLLLTLEQLIYKGVFALELLPEHLDDVVLAGEHVLEVASQCVEAVVGVLFCLLAHDGHSALATRVRAAAFLLLVVEDVHARHLRATVDAGHEHVRTDRLMLLKVLPQALGLALRKGRALDRGEAALRVVVAHLLVAEHDGAAEGRVVADEARVNQLPLDLLFDVDEARLGAQHGALASLLRELV